MCVLPTFGTQHLALTTLSPRAITNIGRSVQCFVAFCNGTSSIKAELEI